MACGGGWSPAAAERCAFGDRLRRLRRAEGWSLRDAADRAGFTYVQQGEIERGARRPTDDEIVAICRSVPGADYNALCALLPRG